MNRTLPVLLAVASLTLPAFSLRADDAKAVWMKKCALCHGADGSGKPAMKTKDYTKAEEQAKMKDEEILKAIQEGVPNSKMKGYAGKLSGDEIKALATFVRSLKK
ncbi:MAG: cytochrome c [Verrucomicrobiae bacterium]|nr:cytochrome c [Verrucomicrobiae bacterium]